MSALRVLLIAAGLALAVQGPVPAQPPAPRDPMVRAGATTKIADHVWAIPDDNVGLVPNVGFVVGDKAALVIETGMGDANGRIVLAEARKLAGTKKLYLVTTHVHPEHDLGAQAFPASVTLIRSNDQVREIAEDGMRLADVFRGRSAVNARLLEGAAYRKADVTFDKAHDLDLGGVKVRILAMGPNHTQGDTAIFVEGERVLFAGDLAMRAIPAFASGKSSLRQWLSTLDALDGLKPRIVVPAHGPIGDAAYIAAYRAYLIRVRERTAAAKQTGKSLEEATASVTAELKADYPDTSRMAGAIRTAYAEAR